MAQHGKGVANVFSSERNGIKFPMHADTYRATMSTGEGELTLWLENKRSKQQWQNKFKNVTECGTAGLPAEAVVALLQKAFELMPANEGVAERGNDAGQPSKPSSTGAAAASGGQDVPTIGLRVNGGTVSLVLTVSIGGVWKSDYTFSLLPVGLDKVDILEARLRDAEEEIRSLTARLSKYAESRVFCVSATGHVKTNEAIKWTGTAPREIPAEHFRLSNDSAQVTVLKAGVYQVQVRLPASNSYDECTYNIRLNGSQFGMGSNYTQMTDIMRLKANDVISVHYGGHSITLEQTKSRFIIHHMGN